jgi:carboxyl-terminal processing protease
VKARPRHVICACLVLIASGCGSVLLGPDEPATPATIFEQLWSGFDRYYAPFLDRHIDWDSIGIVYRGRAAAARNDDELFDVLCSMLRELHDDHVTLARGELDVCESDTSTDPGSVLEPGEFGAGAIDVDTRPAYPFTYGRIGDSVGYIFAPSMGGASEVEWRRSLDAILPRLSGVSAMIVDLRHNSGGDGSNALLLAGCFADREAIAFSQQARSGRRHEEFTDRQFYSVTPSTPRNVVVPTAVLTDRATMSAGEWCLFALRELDHVRTFGDTTAGALGGKATRELGNGWRYTLTVQRVLSSSGEAFEGRGIPPDESIAADSTALREKRDPVMEAALRWLRR